MLSMARTGPAQDGQRERGVTKLKVSVVGAGCSASSAQNVRHSRSMMIGSGVSPHSESCRRVAEQDNEADKKRRHLSGERQYF